MPRVLRIINRLNIGGPTFNAALLTKYMAPEFETLLVAGAKMDSEESSEFICQQLGIDYILIPEMTRGINFLKDRTAYRKIKKIIADFKPDIIHTHASKAGALGRMAALSMNVPVIVHTFHGHIFHSYFNPIKSKLFLRIERYLARRSSAIIALSAFQKDELVNRFHLCKAKKVRVIPLGFDLSRFQEDQQRKREIFRKNYSIADYEIVISIVGRLVPVKNHAMFLRALGTVLKKTTKKVRAFIVGDGEMLNSLRQTADQLGISHNYLPYVENNKVNRSERAPLSSSLIFTSWIKDVEYAVAGSDVIALTSYNEGTPVSLIEAQAAGKPVVTTNVGGIENVVLPNETALLCHPDDDEMFARHLLALIENDQFRLSMSRNGFEQMQAKFHYSRLVKDMKALYYELLDGNMHS